MCWLHHSLFPNKITCLVSYLSLFFHIPYLDKDQASLLPTSMECMKWFQRSLSGNPKINPLFLPTTKPHPLNTLTHGPPLMYWLDTNRWCLRPLYMLHSVWICFFLAFTPFLLPPCLFDYVVRSGWCLSFVAWRMCGFLRSCSLPFIPSLDWALLGQRPSSSRRAHVFLSCVRGPLGYWSYHITSSCLLWLYSPFYFMLPRELVGWHSYCANSLLCQSFA